MKCESCNTELRTDGACDSCELYNAAVVAQRAAAAHIALHKTGSSADDPYLNQYGVFARVNGIMIQVGSPEEAAPFVALTKAALRVKLFQEHYK